MSGAAAIAGNAGHAFLASWYTNRDLTLALAAFDTVAAGGDRYPGSRKGWLSPSSAGMFAECPARYYLRRMAGPAGQGIERIYPEPSTDTQLKQSKELGEKLAQARSACQWLASDPRHDGSDNLATLATELYMESIQPQRWRLFMDQLVHIRDMDAVGVRDHKFTWRADARTYLRVAYGDQLGLYAAVWNTAVRAASILTGFPELAFMAGLPMVRYLIPNVIVVSAKGAHSVMPGEPIYFTEEREQALVRRLHRQTARIEAFTIMAESQGWPFVSEHMQTGACVGFNVCPYTPICHEDQDPCTSQQFQSSSRPSIDGPDDED